VPFVPDTGSSAEEFSDRASRFGKRSCGEIASPASGSNVPSRGPQSYYEVDGLLFDNLIRDSRRWVFMIRVGVSPQAEIPAKAGTPTDDHNSESLHKRSTRRLEVADTLARSGKLRTITDNAGTNRQKIGKKSAKIHLKQYQSVFYCKITL
jgi:hypothetical protein